MRLLKVGENGEISLTADLKRNIPPYAILSHTWGDDSQEVTLTDIKTNAGRHKDGFRKLQFCQQLAVADGLDHFWVDTCCIDKSNNTELSKAINSMFRWYAGAARCYVYMSDVREPSTDFARSRWFSRGWTLQEMLAPSSVEFFTCEGHRIGDKKSLEPQLHELTRVDERALRGSPLSEFSIQERLSWSEGRETTEEEDLAYSLLGILGVFMPLLYGEGEENAFRRLNEETNRLRAGTATTELAATGPNLLKAVEDGDLKLVDDLLRRGAPVSAQTPLHVAAAHGYHKILDRLLEESSAIDTYSGQGLTALMQAAIFGQLESVRKLLAAGCAIEKPLVATRDKPQTMIDTDGQITAGSTALFLAAQNGQTAVVKFLIESGGNVNARTHDSDFTPLITAAKQGHLDCVRVLLAGGADVRATTSQGFTALIYCALGGWVDTARVLLDEGGAELEAAKYGGMTALLEATVWGHVAFVEFLLDRGADVSRRSYDLWVDLQAATALHLAARFGDAAMVRLLVRRGADVDARDGNGRTPKDLALEFNRVEIVAVFDSELGSK